MKKIFVFSFCIIVNFVIAQNGEFQKHKNGLIYSEYTVSKLQRIVDSLNLKYKVCEPKTYYSLQQTIGNSVFLEKKHVQEALKDIKSDISFEEFIKKYPKAEIEYKLPIVKNVYFNDEDQKLRTEFFNVEMGKLDSFTLDETSPKGNWIYSYSEKTDYSTEHIKAFYVINKFYSKKIPEKYAKMILYSECLIDTTSTVFKEHAIKSAIKVVDTIPNKVSEFNTYIETTLKKPVYDYEKFSKLFEFEEEKVFSKNRKRKTKDTNEIEKETIKKKLQEEYDLFNEKISDWESKRLARIDSLKNNDSLFIVKLNEAFLEAKENFNSDDEFEELVMLYLSKNDALELKRSRKVFGRCSMDSSPRTHAKNIALLSAETAKWEVFLKAHLNIMNDRFDRVSDGSHAYGNRNTYIKELEVLNINVYDLLLGTSFRFENPVTNHYFSSISRLGRAISESKDKYIFSNIILDAIADNELDDYNRILMYYLFVNYNSYLENEPEKKDNINQLNSAVTKMPDYISSKLKSL